MSPAEVAAHLDERFRLLTGGRRAAVERHQTLRATIDWSYSVLNPADQAVFECLGVFPASFELEAAQAVGVQEGIAAWDVVDSLTSLVAKSLLTADHGDEGATRYQMLESLRHYAASGWKPGALPTRLADTTPSTSQTSPNASARGSRARTS